VWARTVVIVTPERDLMTSLEQIPEPVCIQAFITKTAIKTLDMAVLHGLPWLNMMHRDLPFHAPSEEVSRGEFRAVVHSQRFRTATTSDHIVKNTRDSLTGKRTIGL
jgi:hypothetical protein